MTLQKVQYRNLSLKRPAVSSAEGSRSSGAWKLAGIAFLRFVVLLFAIGQFLFVSRFQFHSTLRHHSAADRRSYLA